MASASAHNRPKLSCLNRGPGPVYGLPPLVGYEKHDPSKYRNPAYTLRKRLASFDQTVGPGPTYDIAKMTRRGPERPPAFTIAGRQKTKDFNVGPGPCGYRPEGCPPMNHIPRPPAYSLKARYVVDWRSHVPAPNSYMVPSCLGPRIPDKRALGAFTITGLHGLKAKSLGPGPAAYIFNTNTVKRKYPAFSIKFRTTSNLRTIGPGPVHYPTYNTRRNAPKFSFGVKHSECSPPPITPMDDE
ncbi:outer dense fiber protein 3B [Fopius arisanus]|uniref:Outer dense fiber protein 3B n=1 Tax=Fopius arisanus TaxID=64838 RepID=A0A9R1TDK1_9HYME|nr:PREDICTED: outer dense fiber protein 3B-like [Fopius arisanus]